MQELRSTEILDKEIRSDARLKAEAVLKRSQEECEQILAGVEKKIDMARLEKKEFYEKKLADFQKDLDASAPLEKQRMKVSFIQKELVIAVNRYLSELSQEKRLELLLQSCSPEKNSGEKLVFNAYVYGFDKEVAAAFLEKALGIKAASISQTEFGRIVIEDELGLEKNEGIILETQDKSIRLRLTLTEVFGRIMDSYRAELTQALLPEVFSSGGKK